MSPGPTGAPDRSVAAGRRVAAVVALVAGPAAVAALAVVAWARPAALGFGLAGLAAVVVGAWRAFLSRGRARLVAVTAAVAGGVVVGGALAAAGARTGAGAGALAAPALLAALAVGAARLALDHQIDEVRAGQRWPAVAAAAHPALLVNPASGDGRAEGVDLVDAARRRGIDVTVLAEGDDLGALARRAVAAGADALGMAGGDGSLAEVAEVALEAGVPFVCIPAGTRNHLAADLDLDRDDPVAALDAFGPAVERTIDTGTVNDRRFLNNVSLGAYGDLVRRPDYREDKVGTARELLADLATEEREAYDLRLRGPDGTEVPSAYLVQVSVNPYLLDRLFDLGRRVRLDGGRLGVVVVRGDRPLTPGVLAAQAVAGRLAADDAVATWEVDHLEVASDDREVWAGVDGEAVALHPPLRFAVQPGALRVRVPSATVRVAERRRAREAGLAGLVHVALARVPD